jgi:hypothetical protein
MKEARSEEEQIREMIANLEGFMEGESGIEGIDDEYFPVRCVDLGLRILRVMKRSWIEAGWISAVDGSG